MAKRSSVTSYIKNLGKSLGYAAYDAIGDYTPVTKGIIEATKTTFQEAKASMKDIASSGSEKAKSFTSDVLANTLDDLKTGNWYNKKRMDGDMFGDFDFDDDFGDFEDWGDEDGTDTDASTDIITANDDANTRKVISSMGKVSGNLSKSIGYASARNAEYIVAHTRASNAALYNLNAKGFNQVSNILLNMDNTMAGIAKISQPLSNFMENSFTFYTNTTDSLNKINESLDKLVERTAMLDPKAKKDRSVKGSYGSIFAGGSFDASAYADMVKDNIKEISEMAKGIGSMISMMSGGMSGKNTLSLTSMILKGGLQLMMPGMTKESLKQFDKALSNAIGRGFRQMSKNASGSIIGDLLNSLFGLKNDFSTSVKTSNYEKGPVPWDGVARKALVEVIPTYLAKLNAILGGDEKYYDYEEGKFVTVQDIRKKREDLITNAALAAGGDFRSDMMKSVRGNKELESQFDNFFKSAFLNGKDFNLDKLSVDDIVQIFGISKKAATHLKNAYQAQGYNDKGFNKNKNNYHNFLNDIHVNRSDLNDRFANMAGTDNIIVRLSDGSIAEIKDSGKKKGTHAVLGSASERLAEKYNGNMSVAIGLVIPEYLEAIFGALNDGQSFRYNYNTGKFVPVDETKRNARRTRTTRGGSRANAASAEATPVGKVNEDGTTEVSLGGLTVDLNETQLANYNNLATDAQKIDYLKKVARDNQSAKLRKAAEEKVAGTGFGAKLKNAFSKVTSIGEIPGAAASMALNSITNWLNSLFMGDSQGKKPGIFKKIGDFFGKYTFNGYVSDKRQSLYTNALNKLVAGLPEGTIDVIREQLEGGGYVYYALTRDGEKHTVDNKAAEKFYETHGLMIRKKKVAEGINRGELPPGTQDIIRETTDDGKEIWFAIKYNGKNVEKIGTVSADVAERFFGRRKGFWQATKEAFRGIGRSIKTSLFGEGKFTDNLRSYMDAAKANMESGSGSGLIIAGGASGQEEKKKGKFGAATKFIGDTAATAADAIKKLLMSLTAGAEDDKEKVFKGIKDGLKKIGDAKGAIGVGAITGAGVSLLTGAVIGPLGGAAIGAAAGLVSKSTALQDVLFGKGDPESEEYQEGILGALGKAIKGDKKGAMGGAIGAGVGGIVGQFVMGSPIVGAIVGAAGGYISRSEKAQKLLFGTPEDPTALGKLKDDLKKRFPNIAVGALAGALIGPFGVPGNLMVGAGIGYLTTQEKFQHFMFGDPDDPKNKHGLMGKINDIVHNLSNSIQGFIRRMGTRINDWFKKIGTSIKDHINNALEKYAREKADGTGIGGFLGKLAGGLATIGRNGILGPVGLLQSGLRKHNLRRGNAVYDRELERNMTALERVTYSKNNKVRNRGVYGKADEYLASLDNEQFAQLAGMSGEDLRARLKENGVNVKKNTQLAQIRSLITDENKLRQKNAAALKEAQLADPNYSNILQIKHMLMAKFKVKTDANGNVQVDTSSAANKVSAALMDEEQKAKQRSRIARRWAAKLNAAEANGQMSEETTKTEYTDYGVIQLVRNNQGEWVEDTSDKETATTIKNRKSFLDALSSLGPLGQKLSEGLGWIKKKLFGDEEDGEKKGLMDKLKEWFNLDDESSWIMTFLTKAKGMIKNIIPAAIGGVIGFGALGGLFDNLATNIVSHLPWVTTTGSTNVNKNTTTVTVTDANGNVLTQGSDGRYYYEDGTVADAATLANANYDVTGTNNSFSHQLWTNMGTQLLRGNGLNSVGGLFGKLGLNSVGRLFGKNGPKFGTSLGNAFDRVTTIFSGGSNYAKSTANVIGDAAINGAGLEAAWAIEDFAGALGKYIDDGIENLAKVPMLKNAIPKLKESLLKEADEGVASAGTWVAKRIGKLANPAKLTKVVSNIKTACAVIQIIYSCIRFQDSFDDAENVLGIHETASLDQRLVAGFIGAVNSWVPFIGDLLTDAQIVDIGIWLAQHAGFDVSDIVSKREAAKEEALAAGYETVEDYNDATGLTTGGFLKTWGRRLKSFGTEVGAVKNASGGGVKGFFKGLGAGFSTAGKGLWGNITEAFNARKEERSGEGANNFQSIFSGVTAGIGEFFQTVIPSTGGEVPKLYAKMLDLATQGKIGDIWKIELSKFKSDGKFNNFFEGLSWFVGQFLIFPGKLVGSVIGGVSKLAQLIGSLVSNVVTKVKDFGANISASFHEKYEVAKTGLIEKLWSDESEEEKEDKENPISGIYKAMGVIQKIILTPPALIAKIGVAIKNKFNEMVEGAKNIGRAVMTAEQTGEEIITRPGSTLKEYLTVDNIINDEDGTPLGGIGKAAVVMSRLFSFPMVVTKFVGRKIGEFLADKIIKLRTMGESISSNSQKMVEFVAAGDTDSLWETDYHVDEEVPGSGVVNAIGTLEKFTLLPAAVMVRGGKVLKNWFTEKIEDIKKMMVAARTNFQTMQGYVKAGDTDGLWNTDYSVDEEVPGAGFLGVVANIQKFTLMPMAFMVKSGKAIKNFVTDTIGKFKQALTVYTGLTQQMHSYVKAGDTDGLWNADYTVDEEVPGAGFLNVIGNVQKFMLMPMAFMSKTGKAIKNFISNTATLVKGSIANVSEDGTKIAEYAKSGDIKSIWNIDLTSEDEDGNPLSGAMNAVNVVQRVVFTPIAAVKLVGNKISDWFGRKIDAMKSDTETLGTSIDALQRMAEESSSLQDALSIMRQDSFKPSDENILGAFLSAEYGIAKVFNTIIATAGILGNKVKNAVEKVGGWLGDVKDNAVEFATNTVDKVKTFGTNLAEGAWNFVTSPFKTDAGQGSRLPRGGDSGFISQFDPRYQNYKIAGQSFGAKGCGPAVAAMAAKAMGRPMSVNQAMQYSSGYQTPEGVTLDYFQNALGSQGINTEVITGGSSQDMYSRIAAGQKMVLLGRDPSNTSKEYSPFGPNNHYVLATGVDRRGNIIINDPEAKAPKAYNPSILRSASYGIAGGGTRKARKPRRTIRNLRAKFSIVGGSTYDTDIAQAVWSFFKARGYSEPAIAGIMGNMKSESGMNPARLQDSNPPHAAGIVQWENYAKQSGRWKAMADYAASKDRDWTDLESQLEYVEMEMNNPGCCYWKDETGTMTAAGVGPTTLEAFKQSTNVEQATREFEGAFERAGVPHFEARIENAKAYYQLYAGKKTDDSALTAYVPIGSSALASMGTYGTTSGATTGATPAKKERKWTFGSLVSNTIGVFQDVLGNFFNPTTSTDAATTGYSTGYSSDVGSTGYTTGGALGSTSGVNGDMANGFPYYSQKDPAWGKLSYGNYVTASGEPATTYGAAGCGPTTAAMIMKSYNAAVGADPVSAGNFAIAKGDRPPTNSGTSGTIFPHLGEANGLLVNSISKDMVMDKLANRIPVAALMGPGDFTGGGHYVALTGTDDGHIVVNDPYSTDRTGKKWSPNVINQALSVWSIADSEGKGSIRYGKVRKGDYFYSPDGKTKITITAVAEDGTVVTNNMGINKMLNGANTFEEIQAVIDAFYGGGQVSSVNDPLAPMTEPDDGSTHVTITQKQFSNNVLTAAGSGLVSYNDIASRAGGSSGLLLKSRVGSRSSVRASAPVRRGRTSSMPIRRIAGGDSSIADMATTYLNNAKTTVTNAGNAGTISGELVTQLLSSITALLQSIANNTAPVSQIYAALRASLQSGGGTYKEESTKITPVDNHPSGIDQTDSTVDANIKSLVGVLAQLAKG